MAELTAEIVRDIVRNEVEAVEQRLSHKIDTKINELDNKLGTKIDELDDKLEYGIERVLKTIQGEIDDRQDQLAGIQGRLSYHNERIAHLERLAKVR